MQTKRKQNKRAGGGAAAEPSAVPASSMLPLWHSIHYAFLTHIQKWRLPPNAVMVLMHLQVHPEDGEPALLARLTLFPRQTITFALDTLETRGLARRVPHPGDRRRKRVVLTRAGQKLSAGMLQDLLAFEARALAEVPAGKIDRLQQFLTRYAEALARQNAASSPVKGPA